MSSEAFAFAPASAALPAPQPSREPHRPLRVVEQTRPARRPRLLYGIVAVAGALAIAGAQMGLSILATQGSYEVKQLTTQQRELTWQKQILQDEVAGLSSPQYLAANAAALGMVAGGSPNYLRLSDAAAFGTGTGMSGTSSIQALSRAAVANSLVAGVPLVTDPEASLLTGTRIDEKLLLSTPTPPPITDGLPTPSTH